MASWVLLVNSHLTFYRGLTTKIDPASGNRIPDQVETFKIDAYFKKTSLVSDEGKGVPVGSYKVSGYCNGILPEWCNNPTNPDVECTIDHLGAGHFYHQGKISVVRDQVELLGQGTPIQGYFIQGGSR